jgi:glutaminyl-peptide cyclotransferase
MGRLTGMRPLFVVLLVQVAMLVVFAVLVAVGAFRFLGNDERPAPATTNRFDGAAAFQLVRMQLSYGPRPAGSPQSRKLAEKLRALLPSGRFQPVPGGLRNIVGTVPGRDASRTIVVGAHYDTKDLPGFLGANDGAGGTAAVVQLARQLRPRTIGPTVQFVLFDGEESPRGAPDSQFLTYGLRGSKVAADRFKHAEAMILLDFVADKDLSLPREATSDPQLWARLRTAAEKAVVGAHFPSAAGIGIEDDHTPFLRRRIPSIDLIDWDFPCYHKTCDNLSAVSEESLDASGEAVAGLLGTL